MKRFKAGFTVFTIGLLVALGWAYTASGAQAPSSRYRFIWVGNEDGQFTPEQYKYIAENHAIVILAKFHDHWQISDQFQAAVHLKKLNPDIKVIPYFSASYWWPIPPNAFTYGQESFKEKWYLHDLDSDWKDAGHPEKDRVKRVIKGVTSYYTDLSSPEYRTWAKGIIERWMRRRSVNGDFVYDGVLFDAATLFDVTFKPGEEPPVGVRQLLSKIGGSEGEGIAEIKALNAGKQDLIRGISQRMKNRFIVFNGILDSPSIQNRSLAHLDYADAAAYEDFCFNTITHQLQPKSQILKDIDLMLGLGGKYTDKIFLLKTNVPISDSMTDGRKLRLRRFSFGCFLLGYRPDHTFYKYAESPTYDISGNMGIDPDEIDLDFDNPTGQYRETNHVFLRHFEKGMICVNMEDTPQSIGLSRAFVLMNGGTPGRTLAPGDTITIPARDTAFLMLPGAVP